MTKEITNSIIVDDEQPSATSELSTIPLEFDVPIAFQLNATDANRSFTIDVQEPGILYLNWSFEVLSAGFPGPDFFLMINESSVRYIPQLNQYVPDESVQNPLNFWHEISSGFSFHQNREFIAVNLGYIDLAFDLDWEDPIDVVEVSLEVSWQYSFETPTAASINQNFTLTWISDYTWESMLFTIPEDGLYNLKLESYLPYNVSIAYSGPTLVHIPEKVIFLSKDRGIYQYLSGAPPNPDYYPSHHITPGSASTSFWSDEDVFPFLQGEYFALGFSGLFENLNGTAPNVTIKVEPVSTIRLDPNESIELNFNASEPVTYRVAAYLPEYNLNSIRFANPAGYNWTASTAIFPYMHSTPPSLTYMEYPDGEQTTETRFNDIFLMTNFVSEVGNAIRTETVTGEPWAIFYQPFGFSYSYVDGELTNIQMTSSFLSIPFPIIFFEVSATPAASVFSENFNVQMSLNAEPYEELDDVINIATFNATHGPLLHFYRFSVQSGSIYNISVTPTEYIGEGLVAFAVLPSLDMFNQWGITNQPILAATSSDYYGYLAAQTTNRTASIEFTAVIDGVLSIYVAGAGLLGGDCVEAEVKLEEKPPSLIEFGELISIASDDVKIFSYAVDLLTGYDYELKIHLGPSVGSVYTTFFDADGVNPFASTEDEIWRYVDSSEYLYRTFTLTSHYEGVAYIAVILEGGTTISWDVVDTTPPELSIITPVEGGRYLPGTITIEFSADDDIGLKQLNLSIADNTIPLNLTAKSYDWLVETQGVYVITLTAEDSHGNEARSQVVIVVAVDSHLSLELLVVSGLGAFGGVLAIGFFVIKRRGGR